MIRIDLFKANIAFFFLCLMMPGCIEDDLTECGVSLRFQYTRNVDGVDKLASEIKKINIYIFDSAGIFIDEYILDANQLKGENRIKLNLPPGKYSFVAWGNLGTDYELPVFQKGKTTINQATLSLKRIEKTISNHPGSLFFGSLPQADILPALWKNQVLTIDMTKDTNKIRIIAKGLSAQDLARNSFSCRIVSANGDYKFDNSLNSSEKIMYIPKSSIDELSRMISDFVIMRELKDGSTQSRLIITYSSPNGEPAKEICNINLTELLLSQSKTKDLDIEDYYEIELAFDFTSGSATIHIKGWETIDTGNNVG
ncbi:MAG: FimB/Mfa2 family fimbrial subunit [Tannerellaceae bacterium]|jgi:hypothetical protein|nr:FimB/Mfa2 family fimbrial subunit [Tannerellaceae bacterium]